MPLETWFPTLVYYDDVPLEPDVRAAAIAAAGQATDEEELERVRRVTASTAPHTLHLDPRIAPLLDAFSPHVASFAYETLRFDPEQTRFYVGRCWPVVQVSGGYGEVHYHAGAVLSGVYYLETPEGSGGFEIVKPFKSTYDGIFKREVTELTYDKATYLPVESRLILFSSDLYHRALPNDDTIEGRRIAISFDLYSMTSIDDRQGGMPHEEYLRPIG